MKFKCFFFFLFRLNFLFFNIFGCSLNWVIYLFVVSGCGLHPSPTVRWSPPRDMNKNYKSFLRTVHQKRYSRIFCVFVCFLLYDYLQGFHPSYIVLYFVCVWFRRLGRIRMLWERFTRPMKLSSKFMFLRLKIDWLF